MKKTEKNRNVTSKFFRIIGIVVLIWILWCFITSNIKINTETEIIEVGSTYAVVVNGKIIEGGKSYQDSSLETATLFGKNAKSLISTVGKVNVNKIGEYKIRYEPIFSLVSFKKIVKVIDTKAPEIKLLGDTTFCVDHTEFKEPGFVAIDNYDGDITDKVHCVNLEWDDGTLINRKYYIKDSSGNEATAERDFCKCKGAVYLTFDDGPSTENTEKILDILKEKKVKATFFIIGYDESKTEIVKRMKDEGHTIGIHGNSHDYSEVYTSIENTMDNFYIVDDALRKNVEYVPKFVRFIGGSSNTISRNYCKGVMTEATKRVTEEGYVYFDWNVDSGDSTGTKSAKEIYENVTKGIRQNRDNIVLMHDTNAKDSTVEALGDIIDYCIQNGYCILPISSDTTVVQHKVVN